MQEVARQARVLVRGAQQAALATALARDGSGWPYVSLVLACTDLDASPVLLLSDLADHAQNLKADARAALLYEDAKTRQGEADPLTLPRVSVLGRLAAVDGGGEAARLKRRFLARHPGARTYAGFADFRLYRMAVDSAHLVAGFGRIHWMTVADILFPAERAQTLAAAEPDLVARVNRDHGATLRRLAGRRSGGADGPWSLLGMDPEGADLGVGGKLLRVPFDVPVSDPEAAINELIRMADLDPPPSRPD